MRRWFCATPNTVASAFNSLHALEVYLLAYKHTHSLTTIEMRGVQCTHTHTAHIYLTLVILGDRDRHIFGCICLVNKCV